jgi:hypothetical protein
MAQRTQTQYIVLIDSPLSPLHSNFFSYTYMFCRSRKRETIIPLMFAVDDVIADRRPAKRARGGKVSGSLPRHVRDKIWVLRAMGGGKIHVRRRKVLCFLWETCSAVHSTPMYSPSCKYSLFPSNHGEKSVDVHMDRRGEVKFRFVLARYDPREAGKPGANCAKQSPSPRSHGWCPR